MKGCGEQFARVGGVGAGFDARADVLVGGRKGGRQADASAGHVEF